MYWYWYCLSTWKIYMLIKSRHVTLEESSHWSTHRSSQSLSYLQALGGLTICRSISASWFLGQSSWFGLYLPLFIEVSNAAEPWREKKTTTTASWTATAFTKTKTPSDQQACSLLPSNTVFSWRQASWLFISPINCKLTYQMALKLFWVDLPSGTPLYGLYRYVRPQRV